MRYLWLILCIALTPGCMTPNVVVPAPAPPVIVPMRPVAPPVIIPVQPVRPLLPPVIIPVSPCRPYCPHGPHCPHCPRHGVSHRWFPGKWVWRTVSWPFRVHHRKRG